MKSTDKVSFARYVWERFPALSLVSTLLSIGVGLLEGIGIALLVPILSLVGVGAGGGESYPRLRSWLATSGIPFSLANLLLLVLGLTVLQAALRLSRDYFAGKIQFRLIQQLRQDLYDAVFRARWFFFVRVNQGTMLSRLTTDCQSIGEAYRAFNLALSHGFIAVFYLALALSLDWRIAALNLLSFGVMGLSLKRQVALGQSTGTQTSIQNDRLMQVAQEQLSAAKLIKVYGAEQRGSKQFARVMDILFRVQLRWATSQGYLKGLVDVIGTGLLCLALYVSVAVLNTPVAELLVLLFVFFRLAPQVASVQGALQILSSYLPSFRRVEEMLQEAKTAEEHEAHQPPFNEPFDSLSVCSAVYEYEGGTRALDRVDIEIRRGEMVALVGGSGGGKTTLTDLVLRLLEPSEGQVKLNGKKLSDYSKSSWQKHVAYVPQDTFLFQGDISSNIRWANPEATQAEVIEAAKLAQAHEFIERLPEGYATEVGDRGVRLSGGQRQRIALARALLMRPSLLVLDEATSALDVETERYVQKALEGLRGKMALLVVAHRLSTVSNADRIYVLEKARVVESGSGAFLRAAAGRFGQLWDLQASSAKKSDPPSKQG